MTHPEIEAARSVVQQRLDGKPRLGVILGSGLGGLAERLTERRSLSYSEIPGWSRSTAQGHQGQLVAGKLEGCEVLAANGRFHRYEGWSVPQIVFPVRVMAALGVNTLIVSNAAGGIHSQFSIGDIMIITGHIDLQFGSMSLRCNHCPAGDSMEGILRRGPTPYDPGLSQLALSTARREGFAAYPGVYLATLGPNYETRAEYRMMRKLGADVVGMSTVPEVLEAQRLGLRVLAMSMISNLARPDTPAKASHEEVLAAGDLAQPKMTAIAKEVARRCAAEPISISR